MTKKKLKCPKCGTEEESNFTVWKEGSVGYTVYFDGTTIEADKACYEETHFDVLSCQCGYESKFPEKHFLVDVRD